MTALSVEALQGSLVTFCALLSFRDKGKRPCPISPRPQERLHSLRATTLLPCSQTPSRAHCSSLSLHLCASFPLGLAGFFPSPFPSGCGVAMQDRRVRAQLRVGGDLRSPSIGMACISGLAGNDQGARSQTQAVAELDPGASNPCGVGGSCRKHEVRCSGLSVTGMQPDSCSLLENGSPGSCGRSSCSHCHPACFIFSPRPWQACCGQSCEVWGH